MIIIREIRNHVYLSSCNVLYEDWIDELRWTLVGVGLDTTESYLPGQRNAPFAFRNALKRKESLRYLNDAGDVIVVHGDILESLRRIENVAKSLLRFKRDVKIVAIGGEHTITYGIVKALLETYDVIQVVSLDAHYDAYNSYETLQFSHATVMRRLNELGNVSVVVKGVRRYAEEESLYAHKYFKKNIDKTLPTYLSIDLDFFDPSIAPGVADKESNGYLFEDFRAILKKMNNIVGMDVVELNPFLDVSEVTANLAADLVLEVVSRK